MHPPTVDKPALASPSLADGELRKHSKAAAELAAKLAALTAMSAEQLRSEWRRIYRAVPPSRVSHDLLELGVAWKLQEQVQGGLGPGVARRLAELAKTMSDGGDLVRSRAVRLRQGAKLIREWQGETITALAAEAGVGASYFTRVLRLGFLAPDAVAAILQGRQPPELNAKQLSLNIRLPIGWTDQVALLGIR